MTLFIQEPTWQYALKEATSSSTQRRRTKTKTTTKRRKKKRDTSGAELAMFDPLQPQHQVVQPEADVEAFVRGVFVDGVEEVDSSSSSSPFEGSYRSPGSTGMSLFV